MKIFNAYSSPLVKAQSSLLNKSSAPSGASFCSVMAWSQVFASNTSAVIDGIEFTLTNDGVGNGSYYAAGDTTWTSSTGDVSMEARFKSDTAGTSDIHIILSQSGVARVHLTYKNGTKVLNDEIAASDVATGLTGGLDYTFGVKLNQAAGTCTFSDSEANSGSLSVDGGYSNASASAWTTGSNTISSEENVFEVNVGSEAFWLAASNGRYCDY